MHEIIVHNDVMTYLSVKRKGRGGRNDMSGSFVTFVINKTIITHAYERE
jgi:hypothetical protein